MLIQDALTAILEPVFEPPNDGIKPFWIAILALVGGIIGYAVFRSTGWLGTGIGVVLGILVGTVLYAMQNRNVK